MNISNFFSQELNTAQLDAVQTLDGPLLILAGAGSGKTRVLTYRLANMVAQSKARPEEILAVTFTNKAAKEMEARAKSVLTDLGISIREKLWISTFHATCVRILRDHSELLGYKRNFSIYDSSDQLSLIKKVAASLGLKEKEHPAKTFQYRIRWAKMEGLRPEDIKNNKKHYMDSNSLDIYRLYEEEIFRANALDFDDLLMKTLLLLENFPKVLQAYQKRFKYIMIDEYQDTNFIQYSLVNLLAQGHKNLCVVGDEDQSIYSWRGADISNILNFESDYKNAKVVKLEQNYRSTQTIVNAASAVISYNSQRNEKTLFSDLEKGDPIIIREEDDDRDEAKYVVRQIKKIATDSEYKDISIFYRTNAQSRVLEEQLRQASIPYKIIGGLRFYDRMEIKDVMSYIRLLVNPNDDVALKRIINTPPRGIGKTTIQKIEDYNIENKISMIEAIHLSCQNNLFNGGTTKKLQGFLALIANMQIEMDGYPPSEVLNLVLQETEYTKKFELEDTPEAAARIENLKELSNGMIQFEKEHKSEATLEKYLEEMALVSDQDSVDEHTDCVNLMTLHVSKGLEYPYVFIVGMEDNIFPSAQSKESADNTELEEERRLAYVGYIRAMKQLYLSHARSRRVWGQIQHNAPSQFLDEIPDEYKASASVHKKPNLNPIGSFKSSSFRSAINAHKENIDNTSDWNDEFDQTNSFEEVYGDDWQDSKSQYQKGMRVRHPQFGAGTIIEVRGEGEKEKITVIFENNFLKNLFTKYVKLERI